MIRGSASSTSAAMVAVLLVFFATITTLLTPMTANGECLLAVNTTAANWHSASTWTGCTGSGGLPGSNESVSLSGEGVVITIQGNKAAVVINNLYVGEYARLLNHGDLTVTNLFNINEGGDVASTGALAVLSDTSGAMLTLSALGHLAHTGDLIIGASHTATNESINAGLLVSSSRMEIGGSLSLLSTETGQASFTGALSHIKTGSTLRVTGGTGGVTVQATELGLEVESGNLAFGTWDADYESSTGPVNIALMAVTLVVHKGSLLVATGAAKGDGSSGSTQIVSTNANVAVHGEVTIKSGDINSEDAASYGSNVVITMTAGSWAVYAVEGVAGSGSMIVQAGAGAAGRNGAGGSGGSASWASDLMHINIAQDLVILGGNGGNGNLTGGAAGSAIFGSDGGIGPINVIIGRDFYVTAGAGGQSASADGGDSYGVSLVFGAGGTLTVGRDVVLNDGHAGDGINGGSSYSGLLSLAGSAQMAVGRNLKIGYQKAGNSIGGGNGGSCGGPAPRKRGIIGGSVGPITILSSNLKVAGDIALTLCNAGNGLGGNGGSAWESASFAATYGSTVVVGGSLVWTDGNGGNAVNSTEFPTAEPFLSGGNGAYKQLQIAYDAVMTVEGDVRVTAGAGGNLTGASGPAGSAGGVILAPLISAVLNIGNDLRVSGVKSGDVLAGSVVNSTGQAGAACVLLIYTLQEALVSVGGDVYVGGCDAGRAVTNVWVESEIPDGPVVKREKRTLPLASELSAALLQNDKRGVVGVAGLPGMAALYALYSSKVTVSGQVTLIGGVGSDATANDGGNGGAVALAAMGESSFHVGSSVVAIGGRGGNSATSHGGNAGEGAIVAVSVGQVRTGDATLTGGNAGQGFNSSVDGWFGGVAVAFMQESQYHQYGQVTITEGKYRDYNVSKPTYDEDSGLGLFVGASEASQWTIMPCATGGVSYTSSNSSTFTVTLASSFRDCRGAGATIQSRPTGDVSSDVSCLGCTCTGDVLLSDECGSGSMVESAAYQMVVAALEAVAGLW